MKKRILALALAGTTAFSVFGAAISANAAWNWPSTDTRYDVDAYVGYNPIAKGIEVGTASSNTITSAVDKNKNPVVAFSIDSKDTDSGKNETTYKNVDNYVLYNYDVTDEYSKQNVYTFAPTAEQVLTSTQYVRVNLLYITKEGVNGDNRTFIRLNNGLYDWEEDTAWKATPLSGTYYMLAADYENVKNRADGTLNSKTVYCVDIHASDKTAFESAEKEGSTNEFGSVSKYTVSDADKKTLTVDKNGKIISNTLGITEVTNGYRYGDANYYSFADLQKAIEKNYSAKTENTEGYVANAGAFVDKQTLTASEYALLKSKDDYKKNIETFSDTTVHDDAQITVTGLDDGKTTIWGAETNTSGTIQHYKDWTFNADMTGEVTVEPYKVSTKLNGNKLEVEKVEVPTIYAYDFLPANMTYSDAGTIAYYWNNGSMTEAASAIRADMAYEYGRGRAGMGIRYDVVSDWIDFLDELAINGDSKGYVESEAEFVANYADMFYSEPYYDIWTGQQIGSVDVDLYNIKGLLHDIYSLNNASEYYAANTSEMVYLMQQYNKYIGEYIDKTEVGSSEWGELMLNVLNAATEENFKKASDYKKYMNKVEDLEDAYEDATTLGMIKEAEVGMYNLLTTTSSYTASSTADKTELSATLNGLYFNAKSAPGVYSVAPSTVDASRATYTNYNYVVAVVDTDAKDNPYAFSTSLKPGYYSLYPMADYIDNDTTTPNSNYNGNVASKDFNGKYATEEYEWFWNVYQLAVKMSGTNKYQGAVDAINEALNDAVSNLTVTTSPAAVDTGAMEDAVAKYEGKIDTDYNEGYYAKYTQANDYAENVAEGKWQTRIAAMITGVAGEALTYQGTQVTVTKNDMKTVEEAIKNGKTALKAIKEDANYNAAQVTALNKAIAAAEDLVSLYEGTYGTTKSVQSVNKVYTRLVGDKDQMVKSDLTKAIEAIDAAINYSEIVMGWSKNEAGKWQYGTEEGYLSNGWNQVDGGKTWFYFNEDGTAKQSEWWNDNGTWYWFNSNCGAATGWAKVDGEWYYFKGNNAMKTGWEKVDGNWYYMASSGKMVTGWCEIGGKWYYFSKESNSLGQMLYSTTVDGYKLDANGVWVK